MWPSTDRLFGYEQIRHLCRSTNVFFVFSSQHGTVTTLRIIASKKIPPDDSCCKDLFIPQTSKQQAVCQSTSPGLLAGGRRPQTHTEIHEHKHRASSHISTVADCFFFFFSASSLKLEMRLWSTQMVQKGQVETKQSLICGASAGVVIPSLSCQAVITCVFSHNRRPTISSLLLF